MAMHCFIRSLRVVLVLGVAGVIVSCGSGTSTPPAESAVNETVQIELRLTSNESVAEKTGIGPLNILAPCDQPWLTWTGESSGVRCATREDGGGLSPHGDLYVPAPSNGSALTVGVRRYDRPLRPGYQYTLLANSRSNVAAAIFLFDEQGTLVSVPGYTGLAIARPGEGVSFIAPIGVAGFFVQVQSAWQASQDAIIAPYIPNEPIGGGLLDVGRPWTDWAGNLVTGIGLNGLTGHTAIGVPATGESLRYGVQRYEQPLTAGKVHELSLKSNNRGASLLLFMFDANDQLIIHEGSSWVSVSMPVGQVLVPGNPVTTRFTAPTGVDSYAVQIQGEYNADEASFAYPSLLEVNGRFLTCNRPVRGAPIEFQPLPTREYAVYMAAQNRLIITNYADATPANDVTNFQEISPLTDGYFSYEVATDTATQYFEYNPDTGDIRAFRDSPRGPSPAADCRPV